MAKKFDPTKPYSVAQSEKKLDLSKPYTIAGGPTGPTGPTGNGVEGAVGPAGATSAPAAPMGATGPTGATGSGLGQPIPLPQKQKEYTPREKNSMLMLHNVLPEITGLKPPSQEPKKEPAPEPEQPQDNTWNIVSNSGILGDRSAITQKTSDGRVVKKGVDNNGNYVQFVGDDAPGDRMYYDPTTGEQVVKTDDRSIQQIIFDNRVARSTNAIGLKPKPQSPEEALDATTLSKEEVRKRDAEQKAIEREKQKMFQEEVQRGETWLNYGADHLFSRDAVREDVKQQLRQQGLSNAAAEAALKQKDDMELRSAVDKWKGYKYEEIQSKMLKDGVPSPMLTDDRIEAEFRQEAMLEGIQSMTDTQRQVRADVVKKEKLLQEREALKKEVDQWRSRGDAREEYERISQNTYRQEKDREDLKGKFEYEFIEGKGYFRKPFREKPKEGEQEMSEQDYQKKQQRLSEINSELFDLEASLREKRVSKKEMFDPISGKTMGVKEEDKITPSMDAFFQEVLQEEKKIKETTDRDKWEQIYIDRYARFKYLDELYDYSQRTLTMPGQERHVENFMTDPRGTVREFFGVGLKDNITSHQLKVEQADRLKEIWVDAKKQFEAAKRVYFLNENPAGIERREIAGVGTEALLQSLVPESWMPNGQYYDGHEQFLRSFQQIANDEDVKMSDEQKARLKMSFGEEVSQGTFGLIGLLPYFALAEFGIGAVAAETGLTAYVARLMNGTRADQVLGHFIRAGMEEAKVQATLPDAEGVGVGFYIAGQTLRVPKLTGPLSVLNPVLQKMASSSIGGTGGMELGEVVKFGVDALMNDKDFAEQMEEHFPDVETTTRRVLAEMAMNSILGVMHLKGNDFLTDPKKIMEASMDLDRKGYAAEAKQLRERARELEKHFSKLEKGEKQAEAKKAAEKPESEKRKVSSKDELAITLQDVFGFSESQAEATAEIYDKVALTWAKKNGLKTDDWYKRIDDITKSDVKDLLGRALFQMSLRHGSPKSDIRQFLLDFVGTGEGFNAFGHGLYFTEVADVARSYAEMEGQPSLFIGVEPFLPKGREQRSSYNTIQSGLFVAKRLLDIEGREQEVPLRESLEEAISKLDDEISKKEVQRDNATDQQAELEAKMSLSAMRFHKTEMELALEEVIEAEGFFGEEMTFDIDKGAIYDVSVHEGKLPSQYHYASWYDKLGEKERAAFENIIKQEGLEGKGLEDVLADENSTYEDAYMALVSLLAGKDVGHWFSSSELSAEIDASSIDFNESAKVASEKLLENGIDGVVYPAGALDKNARELKPGENNYVVYDDRALSIKDVTLLQKMDGQAKAALTRLANSKFILHALNNPDPLSAVHELAHIFRVDLSKEQNKTALDWAGKKEWDTEAEEMFARAFERYLADGKAPTPELQSVFEQFKQWVKDIYHAITGSDIDVELSDAMVELFDQVLGKDLDQQGASSKEAVKETTLKQEPSSESPLQIMRELAKVQQSAKEYIKAIREGKDSPDFLARKLDAMREELNFIDVDEIIMGLLQGKTPAEVDATLDKLNPEAFRDAMKGVKDGLAEFKKEWRKGHSRDAAKSKEEWIEEEKTALLGELERLTSENPLLKKVDYQQEKSKDGSNKRGSAWVDLINAKDRKEIDAAIKNVDPMVAMRETTDMKNRVSEYVRGIREGRKSLQAEKEALINQMKDVLGSETKLKSSRYQGVLTAIRDAKTRKSLDAAIARIDKLQQEIVETRHKEIFDEITKLSDPKRLVGTRSSGEKTGKADYDSAIAVFERLNQLMKNDDYSDAYRQFKDIQDQIDNGEIKPEDAAADLEALKIYFMAKQPEQVEQAKAELKQIEKEGRSKLRDILQKKSERYHALQKMATDAIAPHGNETSLGKNYEKNQAGIFGRAYDRITETLRSEANKHEGFRTLMDVIDRSPRNEGGYSGPLDQLYRMVADSRFESDRRYLETNELLQNKLKEIYGVDGNNPVSKFRMLNKLNDQNKAETYTQLTEDASGAITKEPVMVIGGHDKDGNPIMKPLTLSPNQAAYVYALSKNPRNFETFEKMGMTSDVIQRVVDGLSTEQKQFVDWAMEEVLPKMHDEASRVYEQLNYIPLAKEPNYITVHREAEARQDITVDGFISNPTTVGHKSLLERAGSNKPFDLSRGFDSVLYEYMDGMNHYVSFAQTMKDLNAVFGNEGVRKAVKNENGSDTMKVIDHLMTEMANRANRRGEMISLADKLRGYHAMSSLALAPIITVKQLTSWPAYIADIGAKDFVSAYVRAMKNPVAAAKDLYDIFQESPYLRKRYERGFDRDQMEITIRNTQKMLAGVPNIADIMMWNIKIGDAGGIAGGYAVYRHHLDRLVKEGVPKEQARELAIREFEEATKMSQQSSNPEDLGYYQSKSRLWKWFTMYKTSPIAYFRQERKAVRDIMRSVEFDGEMTIMGKKVPKPTAFHEKRLMDGITRFLVYHFVLPASFQYVSSGMPGILSNWDEADERDMEKTLGLGSVGIGIVFLGDLVKFATDVWAGKNYAKKGSYTPTPALDKAGYFAYYMGKKLDQWQSEPGSMEQDVVDQLNYEFALSTADLVGVPAMRVKKYVEGLDNAVFDPETSISYDQEQKIMAWMGYPPSVVDEAGSSKEAETSAVKEQNVQARELSAREKREMDKKFKEVIDPVYPADQPITDEEPPNEVFDPLDNEGWSESEINNQFKKFKVEHNLKALKKKDVKLWDKVNSVLSATGAAIEGDDEQTVLLKKRQAQGLQYWKVFRSKYVNGELSDEQIKEIEQMFMDQFNVDVYDEDFDNAVYEQEKKSKGK